MKGNKYIVILTVLFLALFLLGSCINPVSPQNEYNNDPNAVLVRIYIGSRPEARTLLPNLTAFE